MGIKVSAAFPSNYLKAADLQGRHVAVVIASVVMEDMGDDGEKPCVYFRGTPKGVVLNKTNASNIAVLYGDDTDAWIGQTVTLFPAMVDFKGKSVEAIRIRGPMQPQQAGAPFAPAQSQAASAPSDPFGNMTPGTPGAPPPF